MQFEKARAKINLTLDVLRKRDDGYHEVRMIMQTVDFCDYIYLTPRQDNHIEIRSNAPFVPADERNLAHKAATVLLQKTGLKRGITIEIDKRIPVAAGLAGGSTDAAAVLRGLNKLWGLKLSIQELAEISAEIGSDVPFCVYGGTALVTGRGEIVHPLPLAPSLWVILAKPTIAVSTAEVYGALRLERISHRPQTEGMIEALQQGNMSGIEDAAGNVLESVTLDLYPEVARLKEQMKRQGAQVVMMSGSGPTVFGLVEREHRAKRVYNALRSILKEVYLCQTC